MKKRISRKMQYRNAQMFGHTIKSIHHFAKCEMKLRKKTDVSVLVSVWCFNRTHSHACTNLLRPHAACTHSSHQSDDWKCVDRTFRVCLSKKCRQFNAISIKRTHTQACPEKNGSLKLASEPSYSDST